MTEGKKQSVLIVDDQKNWRELLKEILKNKFEVIDCDDYESALEQISNKDHPFHVLVTDMRLVDEKVGNEDGLKLIAHLNQKGDKTKAIVVTGYGTIETTKRVLSRRGLAAYEYLEKRPSSGEPFDYKAFLELVCEAANEAESNMSPIKVFINHVTEDKPLVRKLHSELKKFPWIDLWLDEERLLPGQEFVLEIDKAMEQADAILICMSKTSIDKKGYVQTEIRKAEEQQKLRASGVIYMIPVLLEPCQVPDNLKKYLWVDISEPGVIKSIVKSLETLRK